MDEALDHLETKTYELYDQRIFGIEMEIRSESFECKKVRKFCRMNQYLKGQKILFWSVPVPLIRGPVPLKLRGPPRQLRGPPLQNVGVSCPFVGKVFLVQFYHFW